MAGGDVRITLHDGETLAITAEDVERVYDNLWRLAPRPGAVTLAGMLMTAHREGTNLHRPVELTEAQSLVMQEAVAMPARAEGD